MVLGPETPYIFKIRNYYLNEIFIKLPRSHAGGKETKNQIALAIEQIKQQKEYKNLRVVVDVIRLKKENRFPVKPEAVLNNYYTMKILYTLI